MVMVELVPLPALFFMGKMTWIDLDRKSQASNGISGLLPGLQTHTSVPQSVGPSRTKSLDQGLSPRCFPNGWYSHHPVRPWIHGSRDPWTLYWNNRVKRDWGSPDFWWNPPFPKVFFWIGACYNIKRARSQLTQLIHKRSIKWFSPVFFDQGEDCACTHTHTKCVLVIDHRKCSNLPKKTGHDVSIVGKSTWLAF